MGLFGLGKKKQAEDKNSLELQRQMTANPQQIESNPQSTTVQEENASFQVPDFSEEDLNFDLDLNEFLPDIRKEEKEDAMNSGAEQQDLERIMNSSGFGDKEEEKKPEYGFGGNEVEKEDATIEDSKEDVDHAEIKMENPTINISQSDIPEKSKAKPINAESEDMDSKSLNKEETQKPVIEDKEEETPKEVEEDIPESLEIEKPAHKAREKEDDLPKFDLNKSNHDDLVPPEMPFIEKDKLTQEDDEAIKDKEDPLSSNFENDELSDMEPISGFGNQDEETRDIEIESEQVKTKEHEIPDDEKYIEKEDFKRLLHKEDELNEESKNNQLFADKLKKYNKEQNDLFNVTEDLIQEVKSKLLELDQRLFEVNKAA